MSLSCVKIHTHSLFDFSTKLNCSSSEWLCNSIHSLYQSLVCLSVYLCACWCAHLHTKIFCFILKLFKARSRQSDILKFLSKNLLHDHRAPRQKRIWRFGINKKDKCVVEMDIDSITETFCQWKAKVFYLFFFFVFVFLLHVDC